LSGLDDVPIEEISMSRVRPLCAALAASAWLLVPQVQATFAAEPDRNPPDGFAPSVAAQPSAFELLVAEAQAGNADAMNFLGVAYAAGLQVPLDYATALAWFQKAIEGGSTEAMSNLATMYLRGMGLPRDPANAFRWFVRAAARGNVHSMHTVAVMADEGLGVSRDPALARAMYRRAAESGFAPAMVKTSDRCARSGARPDVVEAYAWLQLASQSDVPEPLQIEVLAKLDRLKSRLGADDREAARLRAAELAGIVKSRALGNERSRPDSIRWARPAYRNVLRQSPNPDRIATYW
jgi:localization factor PodJL